jgi:oligosaccharide repeat unit polymerase
MIDTIGSPWLAYAVLVIVTVAARLRCGSWFAPAAFVGMVWSFFTGASLCIVDYPIPGRGLWMLVVLIVAMQLGALLAHELQPQRRAATGPDWQNALDSLIVPCRRYALLFSALALAGCVYLLFSSLNEFGLPFTPLGVLEVGAKWTLLRDGDVFEPWSIRVLVTWFHPAALLGGVLFACSHRRADRAIAVLTLLPSVLYGVFIGARAAILLGLTCWIGGFVATLCIQHHGRLALFTVKRLILLLVTGAGMLGMFASINAVRDSSWQQDFVPQAAETQLEDYMFGSPAAFADWYAHSDTETPGAEWGAQTFANAFDILHLRSRIIGRYTETSNVIGTERTNIYTLFRGLIEDFTAAGAALIAVCIGGGAGWVYGRSSEKPRVALFWLSAFYAALLYSPIISLFSFNGALLAWLVAWLVFMRKTGPFSLPRASLRAQEAIP